MLITARDDGKSLTVRINGCRRSRRHSRRLCWNPLVLR